MNNKQVLSALLTAIMVLSIATSMAAATDDGGCSITSTQEVQFTNDPLSNRIGNSLAADKSVFLFFYADWCPYCHQQVPIIDELEEEYAGDIAFIRINVTARPDHAEEFNVTALPTMIMISGKEVEGYVREEVSGFAKKAELSAIIAPGKGDELGDAGDYAGVMAPLATSTTCDSCEDCTEKLKSGEYDVVTLTTDITDHKGSCIGLIMGESNVVFDCGGHTIDGDDIAIDPEHGVAMMHGTGNTIKNCVISDFSEGIYLWDATDHKITSNTVISNGEGIELGFSDSNIIDDNTVNENYNGIVLSNSNSNTINSNTVCENTNSDFLIESGTGNSGDENACETPDGWNDAGTTGCTNACSDREHILDQAQEGTNYGYWFDNTVIRWQEFKPTQTSLSQIDLYIKKNGKPGNLRVSIKNDAEDQLWETTVSGRNIAGSGWIEIAVDPSISFTPGDSYYIHVWSDSDSPDPDNRYFWRGQTDSKYDRGISCVEEFLPGYDFAFRTWGSGGCVIPTDNLYINSDTTLCPGVYNIPDSGTPGVIIINADGVVLDCTGVTINGKGSGRGIYNLGFKNVVVTNCEISNYQYGIFLSYYSNDNQLIGNTVTSCSGSGFYLQTSSGVKLTENTVVSNRQGINLYNSSNNELTGNVAYSNEYGFYLGGGTHFKGNKVNQNTACDNTKYDFYVVGDFGGGDFGGGDGNTCNTTSGWNDDGVRRGCTYDCTSGKPDLVITDIRSEDGRICYNIRNIGETVAPGGHCTELYVDGFYQAEDCVDEDLAPSAGMERCFEYDWECRPQEDVVVVCADIAKTVPDQVNDIETGNSMGCGTPPMGVGSLFQSFTPSVSHLTAVDLRLRAGGAFPAEGYKTTIRIRSGTFDGAVLATATAFVPDPGQPAVNFELASPIKITPGATYLIEWISPKAGGKVLTWMIGEDDPYPDGTAFGCMGTAIPDEDFIFTTYSASDHVDESNEENNCMEAVFECAPSGLGCVDFEDLPIGAMFYVQDVFTDSGATITVQPFQWDGGQWTSDGFAEVGNTGDAGGTGNEMQVNNVNLGFDFGSPYIGLSLLFGEYGGNLNIEINGDFQNFKNFAGINGTVVGNVSVTVVNGPGDYRGRLELSGTINSFAIGGQELWLDYVCPIGAGGCVIPTDDLYINSDTTLCPGFYDIPDVGADGVIIINADGVVLDCNGATMNGTGSGYGIYNNGHDGVTIRNCGVANYDRGGIYVQYAQNNDIVNNSVWSNWAGIFLTSSDNSTITGNNASNNYYGIRLRSSSANTISDNVACHSRYYGIYLWDSSTVNVISDNTANSNTHHGISLSSSSSGNGITGNTANSNQIGLYLNATSTGNAIEHNTFCNNSVYDIQDEDSNSGDENTCSLTDNWNDAGTTTGCTHTCTAPGSGVCYDYTTSSWMTPPPDDNWNVDHIIVCNDTVITLNGNLTIDSGGELGFNNVTLMMNATEIETDEYSIEVNSGGAFHINSKDGSPSNITNGDNTTAYYTFHVNSGSDFTMQNSELHNCGYDWRELPNKDAGLWINTDDTVLVNNTITGNYYVGAFFYQSDNHTVVDNTVKLNRWHGIRLIASNGSRIIGNSVESTIDGITLSHSPDGEILNNVVSSNQDGIVVSHSPDATIAENTASSNGRYGIRVTSSSDCGVRNNTANSNADGIMVSSSLRAIITGNTADSNRDDGIFLSNSPDSVVMDNTANLNNRAVDIGTGIVVHSSPATQVELNVVTSNWRGMFIDSSSGCTISENNASENKWYGIHLNSSRANNLTENTLHSNKGQWDSAGLHLSESEDNRIIGNYATANLHGMVLYKSPNSRITVNTVDGNNEDGIALDSSDRIAIAENTVTANSVGISLHDSDNVEIIHNNASDNGHTGIALSTSKNNLIIENVAVRNRYGIALSSSSVNEIRNNTATSNNFGMSLRWSSNNNTVTSNNFDSSMDYGANLFRVYNNTILHNNFSNSKSVGVGLERSDKNLVVDNDMRSAHNYGIDLFESRWNVIEMNDVRYSGDVGIGLSSSNGNIVAGNTAEGSGTGVSVRFSDDNTVAENNANSNDIGIYMRNSDSNTITGNNVSLSNNVGIDLSISDGNGIFANTAFGNPNYGIHLYSSASNVLNGNNVTSNGVGVYLDWSDSNLISGNTVDENDLTGIALYMSSDENEVIGNEVNSNGNISIRISSSDNNTVMDNTALYNGIGIFLDWSGGNIIADNRADLNKYHGISLDWFSCNNEILNNSASSNIVGIALSWSGNNTIADNVANFNNVSILLEWSSSNNELIGNTANHNEHNGISLHWSSNDNEIAGNTANDNRIGLYFDSNSTGNVVADNTFCDNSLYDIHDEDANSGDENTCNSTLNWNDDGTTGCTYGCGAEPAPSPTPTPTQPVSVPDGDLDGDGEVTAADAAIVLEIATGSRPCDAATLAAADVCGDGRITSLDSLMILQAAAGGIVL